MKQYQVTAMCNLSVPAVDGQPFMEGARTLDSLCFTFILESDHGPADPPAFESNGIAERAENGVIEMLRPFLNNKTYVRVQLANFTQVNCLGTP